MRPANDPSAAEAVRASDLEGAEPIVLLLGFSLPAGRELVASRWLDLPIELPTSLDGAHELLHAHPVAVLCLGPELAAQQAHEFLHTVVTRHVDFRGHAIVLAAGQDPGLFQSLVDADRIYFLSQKPPSTADAERLLAAAVDSYLDEREDSEAKAADPDSPAGRPGSESARTPRRHRRSADRADRSDDRADRTAGSGARVGVGAEAQADAEELGKAPDPARLHRILELTTALARQSSPARMAEMASEALVDLVGAERAFVYLYEPQEEVLRWAPRSGEERLESAAAGIVSFVLRTRCSLRLERVGEDPRYEPEVDNDRGPADDRFLAVPIVRGRGRVWAVMVVLRSPHQPAFSAQNEADIGLFADELEPLFERLIRTAVLGKEVARTYGHGSQAAGSIFREEAVEQHRATLQGGGEVLELSPRWIPVAYRLVIVAFAAALVFTLLARIHQYARGTAVVRIDGRTEITSSVSGTAVAVDVVPGSRVQEGDTLARLYGAAEEAELDRVSREFQLGLASRLRDPSDPSTERTLSTLLAQKQMAERRLQERTIRAPADGVVRDVWIRSGQHINPGQPLLDLEERAPELRVISLLPGQYLPQLAPGMLLRLELKGYPYTYQELVVDSVGDEAVGPEVARRALGPGIGDAIPLDGPVVFVSSRLQKPTFESAGKVYEFHDGILGKVEVRTRSEPLLLTLVPGLRALWPESHAAGPESE